MKRMIAIVVSAALVLTPMTPAFAAQGGVPGMPDFSVTGAGFGNGSSVPLSTPAATNSPVFNGAAAGGGGGGGGGGVVTPPGDGGAGGATGGSSGSSVGKGSAHTIRNYLPILVALGFMWYIICVKEKHMAKEEGRPSPVLCTRNEGDPVREFVPAPTNGEDFHPMVNPTTFVNVIPEGGWKD